MSWIGIGWEEIKKLRIRNFSLHFFQSMTWKKPGMNGVFPIQI